MVFAAVLANGLAPAPIINGYLIVGFFGVGLAGLAVARFSSETSGAQAMSLDWLVPIGVSVGVVLALGLVISLVGMGGLDDVTRSILRVVGAVGSWVLKPVLLGVGYLVGWLVDLINWFSGLFGGGDLKSFDQAMSEIERWRQSMEAKAQHHGPPAALVALLKWGGFLLASVLAGWILFRIFRFRRFLREEAEVEETRESFFSWRRANQDLSSLLSDWWRNLTTTPDGAARPDREPRTPREVYHSLLALAERRGYPRQEWQTPKEHQHTLAGTDSDAPFLPPEPVGRIVEDFQRVHYGHGEVDDAEMEQLLRDWAAVRQSASSRSEPPPDP